MIESPPVPDLAPDAQEQKQTPDEILNELLAHRLPALNAMLDAHAAQFGHEPGLRERLVLQLSLILPDEFTHELLPLIEPLLSEIRTGERSSHRHDPSSHQRLKTAFAAIVEANANVTEDDRAFLDAIKDELLAIAQEFLDSYFASHPDRQPEVESALSTETAKVSAKAEAVVVAAQ